MITENTPEIQEETFTFTLTELQTVFEEAKRRLFEEIEKDEVSLNES